MRLPAIASRCLVSLALSGFTLSGFAISSFARPQGPLEPESLGYVALEGIDTSGSWALALVGGDSQWLEVPQLAGLVRHYPTLTALREDTRGDLQGALQSLRAGVLESPHFEGPNGTLIRAGLARGLQIVRERALQRAQSGLVPATDLFQPRNRGAGAVVSSTIWFEGSEHQVVLSRIERPAPDPNGPPGLAAGDGRELVYATLNEALEFRYVALLVEDLFTDVRAEPLLRITQRLESYDRGWTNYLAHGFSQYPWEVWANSAWTDSAWDDPPRRQLILMHPELAFLADLRSSRRASLDETLLLHVAGLTHYFGDERDWFLGLSASTSIPGEEGLGLGLGATVHFGHTKTRSLVPHLSLGVVWHDTDASSKGPFVTLGVDLWRLADATPDGPFERQRR